MIGNNLTRRTKEANIAFLKNFSQYKWKVTRNKQMTTDLIIRQWNCTLGPCALLSHLVCRVTISTTGTHQHLPELSFPPALVATARRQRLQSWRPTT